MTALAIMMAFAFSFSFVTSVATSAPASAHTADLTVVADCGVDGYKHLHWTLTLANVPNGVTANIEARSSTSSTFQSWNHGTWSDWSTKATGVPSTQHTVTWDTVIPGNTVGDGPWEYVYTTFSNGVTLKSDNQVHNLKGDCKPSPTEVSPTEGSVTDTCSAQSVTWPVETDLVGYHNDGTAGPGNTVTSTPYLKNTSGGYVLTDVTPWSYTFKTVKELGCIPPPVQCVVVADSWAKEDIAPVFTPDGLLFAGPSVQSVNWYQRVSAGNMQGLTGMSYTIAAGETGQPAQLVVEVNPNVALNLGGPVLHYATISTNIDAGTSGVIDAQSALWSSTKILSGDGSLGHAITWDAMVALMPDNTLLSAPSLHLKTKSELGDTSTITSVSSSCGSTSFVPDVPAPKIWSTVTSTPPMCLASGGGTYIETTTFWRIDPVWNATLHTYVDGVAYQTGHTDSPPLEATLEQCPPPTVVPSNPQIGFEKGCLWATWEFSNDVKLGENEVADAATFNYSDASGVFHDVVVEPNGEHVKIKIAFEGTSLHTVQFGEKGKALRTEYVSSACLPQPEALASTGAYDWKPFIYLAAKVVLLGASLIVLVMIRRRNDGSVA